MLVKVETCPLGLAIFFSNFELRFCFVIERHSVERVSVFSGKKFRYSGIRNRNFLWSLFWSGSDIRTAEPERWDFDCVRSSVVIILLASTKIYRCDSSKSKCLCENCEIQDDWYQGVDQQSGTTQGVARLGGEDRVGHRERTQRRSPEPLSIGYVFHFSVCRYHTASSFVVKEEMNIIG